MKNFNLEISSTTEVKLGDEKLNTVVNYNIKPEVIVEYFKNLQNKYNFKIAKIKVEQKSLLLNRDVAQHLIRECIEFVLYSSLLEEKNINIKSLIKETNKIYSIEEWKHSQFLSILAYKYSNAGYKIEFSKDRADFLIGGIRADLKVRQSAIYRNPKKIEGKSVNIRSEVISEIFTFIRSRAPKGVKQSELLFCNLDNASFFSLIGLSFPELNRIVPPKKYRIILYSSSFFPHNMKPTLNIGKKNIKLGTVKSPDLYQFKCTYIDLDGYLWQSLAQI